MKKFHVIAAIILLSGFVNVKLKAQISASLSEDTILIGNQVQMNVRVETDVNDDKFYFIPESASELMNGLEVLTTKTDTLKQENKRVYSFRFLLTSFDSGTYHIEGIPVVAGEDSLYTNPVMLRVESPVIDTAQAIKDIKEPINTPLSLQEILPYAEYSLAGLLLAGILTFFIYRLIRRKKPEQRREAKISPHDRALHQLDYLKNEKLWQKGRSKEHYTILSDTIRIYIEESYGINAREMLTREILAKFKRHSYDDSVLTDMLESLLNLSDMVKFAKEEPGPSENETNLNKAYIFIEKTRPVENENLVNQENKS